MTAGTTKGGRKLDRKLVAFRIPEDLHRRLKVVAARTGRSMSDLAEVAVEQYLGRLEVDDG
jgi:predicted DNA-binding protein